MREIIIIKTSEGEKILSLLNKEQVDYQVVYDDVLDEQKLTREQIWRRDARLASQDKERNKEIKAWDKVTSKIDDE